MTQRFFSNEQYEVFTGWDRPLQMYYLNIYSRDPERVTGDENGMIFSSLLMHNPSILPDAIEGKIASYTIPIPATLRQDLYDDAAENRGNLPVNYDLGIAQNMETFEVTTLPGSSIDEAVVPGYEGTVFRLSWDDGVQSLLGPQHLNEVDVTTAATIEKFTDARWIERAGDTVLEGLDLHGKLVTLSVIEGTYEIDLDGNPVDPSEESVQATRDAPTPNNLLVTRVRELAERVQGWFHSSARDQGMER